MGKLPTQLYRLPYLITCIFRADLKVHIYNSFCEFHDTFMGWYENVPFIDKKMNELLDQNQLTSLESPQYLQV